MESKQIIVVRKDLGMSRGKMSAQVAHASLGCVLKCAEKNSENGSKCYRIEFDNESELDLWLNGKFTKIVLSVDNEQELLEIYENAKKSGLNTVLITDAGLTEFTGPTNTCIGIGPHFPESFIGVTNHLRTFR